MYDYFLIEWMMNEYANEEEFYNKFVYRKIMSKLCISDF